MREPDLPNKAGEKRTASYAGLVAIAFVDCVNV